LETRYWIRKVPPLQDPDPFMLDKIKDEVPAFMYFLRHRSIASEKKSRMWFTPEQLCTEALLKIKSRFRNKIETELLNIIMEMMDGFELDCFCFTNKDAIELLKSNNIKATRADIKLVIDNWNIEATDNTYSYVTYKYDSSGIAYESHLRGRFYSIKRSDIAEISML